MMSVVFGEVPAKCWRNGSGNVVWWRMSSKKRRITCLRYSRIEVIQQQFYTFQMQPSEALLIWPMMDLMSEHGFQGGNKYIFNDFETKRFYFFVGLVYQWRDFLLKKMKQTISIDQSLRKYKQTLNYCKMMQNYFQAQKRYYELDKKYHMLRFKGSQSDQGYSEKRQLFVDRLNSRKVLLQSIKLQISDYEEQQTSWQKLLHFKMCKQYRAMPPELAHLEENQQQELKTHLKDKIERLKIKKQKLIQYKSLLAVKNIADEENMQLSQFMKMIERYDIQDSFIF